ncbi:hypothetical protein LY76DRAFT_353076 [Colletotrichum caudatum]|nr:hypothetical protein LY76DRAFT_353076 [Colletotrichum caudatum]
MLAANMTRPLASLRCSRLAQASSIVSFFFVFFFPPLLLPSSAPPSPCIKQEPTPRPAGRDDRAPRQCTRDLPWAANAHLGRDDRHNDGRGAWPIHHRASAAAGRDVHVHFFRDLRRGGG